MLALSLFSPAKLLHNYLEFESAWLEAGELVLVLGGSSGAAGGDCFSLDEFNGVGLIVRLVTLSMSLTGRANGNNLDLWAATAAEMPSLVEVWCSCVASLASTGLPASFCPSRTAGCGVAAGRAFSH